MKLVAYLRVSTDDKGQDPNRQRDVVQAWAERHGHEVASWHIDEGTSGATDPLKRQFVIEAIDSANATKADAIVVESVDRWTRGGVEALSISRFFLRLDENLRLISATTPTGMTAEMEEMWDSMMATVARMFRTRLQEQIKSGLARAKAKGWPNGQPGRAKKDPLTPDEVLFLEELVAKGHGSRVLALHLSNRRGCLSIADPKVRKEKSVTQTWVRAQLRNTKPDLLLRMAAYKAKAKKRPDLVEAHPKAPRSNEVPDAK